MAVIERNRLQSLKKCRMRGALSGVIGQLQQPLSFGEGVGLLQPRQFLEGALLFLVRPLAQQVKAGTVVQWLNLERMAFFILWLLHKTHHPK